MRAGTRFALLAAAVPMCGSSAPPPALQDSCPAQAEGRYTFPGGAFAMRSALQVNPDGAATSYTRGDHGQTYITNGLNRIGPGGTIISCSNSAAAKRDCRARFLDAEKLDFRPGTDRFCVFAFEVVRWSPEVPVRTCGGSTSRYVIGDGLGRPATGSAVTVTGATIATYPSTTALKHRVGGRDVYLDSAVVPASVTPRAQASLLGTVVWVRYRGRGAFAVIGDSGPAFGEGSVALHQLLREGSVRPVQPVGPIPRAMRCQASETQLAVPFVSFPDGPADRCRPGHVPTTDTDLRAYSGIDFNAGLPRGPNNRGVEMIILSGIRLPRQGQVIQAEVTPAALEAAAAGGGYDSARLNRMADCVRP